MEDVVSFSERIGLKKPRETIQLNSMDGQLRMGLYNLLHDRFVGGWFTPRGDFGGPGHRAARAVWTDFWYQPVDQFSDSPADFHPILKNRVLTGPWNGVYDLLEFVQLRTVLDLQPDAVNALLEREMSGYRFREQMIVPVSDNVELAAIDGALSVPEPFTGARRHIIDALDKLSQKPEPDVRNAITEAVSAVESAARVVAGKHKATLADALKVLEKAGNVHPALKDAWLKLYGYTSDEHGLRHAMTEDPNIDFATAKYMVVSCAAFVNFLSMLPPQV
jgi:hypothetical protein